MALSILLFFTKNSLVRWLAKPLRWLFFLTPFKLFILLLLCWTGFSLVLLTFPSHRWMIPQATALPFQYSLEAMFACWAGIVVIMKLFPSSSTVPKDLSPWTAGFWLLLILGVDAYLIFYNVDKPIGAASEDTVVFSAFARLVFDLKDYRFFFNGGAGNSWQPFYQWLMNLLWYVNPDTPGVLLERITSACVNLAIVIFLYLAGKEAAGRRVGVFAAGLATICLPLLTKTLACQHGNTHTLFVALSLWLFFRTLRSPKLINFLLWGTSVALGIYAYIMFRPLVPLFVFSSLLWIYLKRKEERVIDKSVHLAVFLTLLIFFFYIFFTNHLYATDNDLARMVNVFGPWLPCMVVGLFVGIVLASAPRLMSVADRYPGLLGWVAGTWICMIISFPQMANPHELWNMVSAGASGRPMTFKSVQVYTYFFDVHSCDWINLHFPNDSFFGFTELIFGALGLALALVRPNLNRVYLLLAFLSTFGVWLLSESTHSERMMVCVPPFLLLGAMGAGQVWDWITLATRSVLARVIAAVFLVGLFEWTAQGDFDRVHNQWAGCVYDVDNAVCQRAANDQKEGKRVYIGPDLTWTRISYMLYENHPVQVLKHVNPIYVAPNDKPQDLVIYFRGKDDHQLDDQMAKDIQAAFPKVTFETIRNPFDENGWPLGSRCQIAFADILRNRKQTIFQVKKIKPPVWTREYFAADTGMRPAVLDWVDCVPHISDPFPTDIKMDYEGYRYQGVIHVKKGGKYKINCANDSRTILKIDGRDVLDMVFPRTEHFTTPARTDTNTLNLEAGNHTIQVTGLIPQTHQPPVITLSSLGTPDLKDLSLWSSFDF